MERLSDYQLLHKKLNFDLFVIRREFHKNISIIHYYKMNNNGTPTRQHEATEEK